MTREDLIKFNIYQQWAKARIKFFENQIETIGKLTNTLSDMPKGSRVIYDNEAESLSKLLDKIEDLKREVETTVLDKEAEIQKQLQLLEPTKGLILYHYYIVGDSIKYIAEKVIHYASKYTYDLKKEAEREFDKLNDIQEKKG